MKNNLVKRYSYTSGINWRTGKVNNFYKEEGICIKLFGYTIHFVLKRIGKSKRKCIIIN